MKIESYTNLGNIDRVTRTTIGMGLAMAPLYMADSVELIAAMTMASVYPLMTGLIAFDPLFALVENVKWKFITFKKAMPSLTA